MRCCLATSAPCVCRDDEDELWIRSFSSSGKSQGRHRERQFRVRVKIIEAKDLKKHAASPQVKNPSFIVKLDNTAQKSRQISSLPTKDGLLTVNQTFIFDVYDPKNAHLTVHAYGKYLGFIVEHLGSTRPIDVANILGQHEDHGKVEATWYNLFAKNGTDERPPKVLMQVAATVSQPEEKVRMFIGTWNLGRSRPPKDLSPWIPRDNRNEIIAIGTQECDFIPRPEFPDCNKEWLDLLKKHLGNDYKIIRSIARGSIRLVIFIKEEAEKAISEVDSGTQGVGNVIANKGAVCVSFKYWDTSLCFVNSHFAPHDGECQTRHNNYRDIVGNIRVGIHSMDILNQFHHVFWLGDLNYRLDFSQIESQPLTPQRRFWNQVVHEISGGHFRRLLEYDELQRERAASQVFHGFEEEEISFPPTFKMQRNSLNSYDRQRMPAWCDRILCRTAEGCHMVKLMYSSCQEIQTSDHKPVYATFELTAYAVSSSGSTHAFNQDDKRWHIRFTSLRATNLKAADLNGYSDPYLKFIGPNLERDFHTTVKFRTLNPSWSAFTDLPTLVLSTLPLKRVEKEYLLVQVFDYDFMSSDDIIGYAVIPLASAVIAYRGGSQKSAEFKVEVTHRGIPCGTLGGEMKLSWEKNITKRKSRFAHELAVRSLNHVNCKALRHLKSQKISKL